MGYPYAEFWGSECLCSAGPLLLPVGLTSWGTCFGVQFWRWNEDCLERQSWLHTSSSGSQCFIPTCHVLPVRLFCFFFCVVTGRKEGRKGGLQYHPAVPRSNLSLYLKPQGSTSFQDGEDSCKEAGGGWVRKEEEEYKGYSAEVLGGLLGNWNSLRLH